MYNSIYVSLLLFLWFPVAVAAFTFSPVSPVVPVNGKIDLSILDTVDDLDWRTAKGIIQNHPHRKYQVLYTAPSIPGFDVVTVIDSNNGQVDTLRIEIVSELQFADLMVRDNASWQIFNSRKGINKITLSNDSKIMWVATNGGLEQRDATTGRLLKIFSNIDGLIGSIGTLYRDSDDGLWMGTAGGLAYLDVNQNVTLVTPDNSPLPSYFITDITSDKSGGFWLSTIAYPRLENGGLAHYTANQQWEFENNQLTGLPTNDVQSIKLDLNGELWASAYNGDVEIYREDSNGRFTLIPPSNIGLMHRKSDGSWETINTSNSGLPSNYIQDFQFDSIGGLWISTGDKGLAHRDVNGSWQVFNTQTGLPNDRLHNLIFAENGDLWIGIADGRLLKYTVDGQWKVLADSKMQYSEEDSFNTRSFFVDAQQRIWFGNAETGLSYFDNKSDTWFHSDTSALPSNYTRKIIYTKKGQWIATKDKGIVHLTTKGNWQIYNKANSALPSNVVQTILSDSEGNVWVGTDNGLAHFNLDTLDWQIYSRETVGFPSNNVTALHLDKQGYLWVGLGSQAAMFGGLAHQTASGTWEIFSSENTPVLSNANITALSTDHEDGLWIGTASLYRIEDDPSQPTVVLPGLGLLHMTSDGQWITFNKTNGLPANDIQSLYFDQYTNELWVGTGYQRYSEYIGEAGGIAHRFSDGTWEIFNKETVMLQNSVQSIQPDGRGGLWVGSYRGGITHRKPNGEWEIAFVTANSSIPGNEVYDLSIDEQQNIWMTTDHGVAKLSYSQKNQIINKMTGNSAQGDLLNNQRAALIIHSRGESEGRNQDISIEFMTSLIYKTLQTRGFDHDEIYLLSYKLSLDINGDNISDAGVVDAPVSVSQLANGVAPLRDLTYQDVQDAFTWAKQQQKLDYPLFIAFVDHALPRQLRLNPYNEVLTADALKSLLDDYQQVTGNQVIVFFEACHTGSFIKTLSAQDRLIVTSTDGERAFYDGLGSISFSKFYFDNLRRGDDFSTAFENTTRKLQAQGQPFEKQIPQLDDDGDGIANTSRDGKRAHEYCLNSCFGALAGEVNLRPEIDKTTTVNVGEKVSLKVRVGISEGTIQRVSALIITPENARQRSDGGFSITPVPSIPLAPHPDDSTLWQGEFSEFTEKGNYTVTFIAEDQDGFITPSQSTTLTQQAVQPIGTKPIIEKYDYQKGDIVQAFLPALPEGQTQYVGLGLADNQTILVLTDLNKFTLFNGIDLTPWQGNEQIMNLPAHLFKKGQYSLYLLRVQTGLNPMQNVDKWELGTTTLEIR